jgi:protein TonB
MNHLFNNEQRMTEIIFAHRNKAYGAYAIRSSYGETTIKAIGYMLLGITSVLSVAWHFSHNNPPQPEKNSSPLIIDSVITIPVNLNNGELEKQDPQPTTPDKPASTASADGLGTVVSDTVEPTSSTETIVTNGTESVTTTEPSPEPTTDGGNGKTKGLLPGIPTGSSSVVETIKLEKMPQFKGGLAALNDFIRRNVHYPPEAIEEGRQGKLYVRFIVDENGKVSSAELLNTSYKDLNTEALRVVGIIPDFESPGIANGQPVKTYYQVPINFRLR